MNLDYDPMMDQITINTIKIDANKSNIEMEEVIDRFNTSNDYNLNKSRRMLNRLFKAYAG